MSLLFLFLRFKLAPNLNPYPIKTTLTFAAVQDGRKSEVTFAQNIFKSMIDAPTELNNSDLIFVLAVTIE